VGTLPAIAAIVTACGGGSGYQPWWDQNKNAIVPPDPIAVDAGGTGTRPDAGTTQADGGHPAPDAGSHGGTDSGKPPPAGAIRTVIYILMAKQPWSAIEGSSSAPYINGTLLSMGAYSEAYYAAPDQITASLPNVVWLEAGDDLGFVSNAPPATDHSATTDHLVDQLEAAGISWKAYVEHATAGTCPIVDQYPYRTYDVPFLFFDDVVGNPPSSSAKRCVQHVVPLTDLAADLAKPDFPRYAFVVPDVCNDMHDDCNTGDRIQQGDDWLAANVPPILASSAYKSNGALFVAWDYSPTGYDPVGFIALSATARAGHASTTQHTTSTTLRSLQEIFGVGPFLGDAAKADDIADMFTSFP
jgi:hypothetical protein